MKAPGGVIDLRRLDMDPSRRSVGARNPTTSSAAVTHAPWQPRSDDRVKAMFGLLRPRLKNATARDLYDRARTVAPPSLTA